MRAKMLLFPATCSFVYICLFVRSFNGGARPATTPPPAATLVDKHCTTLGERKKTMMFAARSVWHESEHVGNNENIEPADHRHMVMKMMAKSPHAANNMPTTTKPSKISKSPTRSGLPPAAATATTTTTTTAAAAVAAAGPRRLAAHGSAPHRSTPVLAPKSQTFKRSPSAGAATGARRTGPFGRLNNYSGGSNSPPTVYDDAMGGRDGDDDALRQISAGDDPPRANEAELPLELLFQLADKENVDPETGVLQVPNPAVLGSYALRRPLRELPIEASKASRSEGEAEAEVGVENRSVPAGAARRAGKESKRKSKRRHKLGYNRVRGGEPVAHRGPSAFARLDRNEGMHAQRAIKLR